MIEFMIAAAGVVATPPPASERVERPGVVVTAEAPPDHERVIRPRGPRVVGTPPSTSERKPRGLILVYRVRVHRSR